MTTSLKSNVPSVNGWNAAYIEDQYQRFKADPASVPDDLRAFLQGFDLALSGGGSVGAGAGTAASADDVRFALCVRGLIDTYRAFGHLHAAIDPFGRVRPAPAQLSLAYHGLSESDFSRRAAGHGLPLSESATLGDVVGFLLQRYCGATGYQFMHIEDPAQRAWFLARVERGEGATPMTREDRLDILRLLAQSEQIETFLQKRYQGQKRFSLEGGESLIPLLDWILRAAADHGVQEIAMGMPHRGRVNVLNNTVGKSYEQIFTEFEHNYREDFVDGGGDVKYHRGYSGERKLPSGKTIHVSLASNPSHLESVNAVVCGRARAKQRLRGDTDARKVVLPVLVHGDGAVIGQGVVAETLNMSQLEGYTCGGTVHAVVNNLVAFTTDPEDDRTGTYCTDIGMIIGTPVLHVNGDDPEAVVAAARLATDYRQTFGRDIFIDMWCYRKYGHNETDNASFTQPELAELIKNNTGVLSHYAQRLQAAGHASAEEIAGIRAKLDAALEAAQDRAKKNPHPPIIDPAGRRWKGIEHDYSFKPVNTGVTPETIREVCAALGRVPEGFTPNPGLKKLLAARAALADDLGKDNGATMSYADAESLAFGTLLLEGHAVRISGQDARRGTFSHRHAVIRDFKTGEKYTPLNTMRPVAALPDDAGKQGPDGKPTQARFCVYDSPLSEYSVMGFDYGYSMADPHMLVCWEAQFGDFCNTAQVMIDQYLASAEIKWDRWSGLVLLLPHGYEGAGPEHSSARMERFLQLCANENMEVVYPSTAAQVFHMLRRQVKRSFRKPLIVMTPKSMLRPPTSRIDELVTGRFMEVIDDPHFEGHKDQRKSVSRVIFCTGKFYHELAARRDAMKRYDTAIVRIEQLYPLHVDLLREVIARYPAKAQHLWAQEEPRNIGAYLYMDDAFRNQLGAKVTSGLTFVGRDASATPAIGDTHMSDEQQEAVLTRAVGPAPGKAAASPAGKH